MVSGDGAAETEVNNLQKNEELSTGQVVVILVGLRASCTRNAAMLVLTLQTCLTQ